MEMPSGKVKDLPPPPTTQAEVERSPFRKAFEHSRKAEPCIFRNIINNKISLMVGVHVDDIIVSGKQDICDEFFDQLRQRFPMKSLGELKMYTGCAFERDWDNGILEINQTAFAINMVEQCNISTTEGFND